MNISSFSCPYPGCGQVSSIAQDPIHYCDGCDSPVIFCDACRTANRIWAWKCRACGEPITSRKAVIAGDKQSFLDTWERSRGLFYQRAVPGSSVQGWSGKLVGIDGSFLVFGGTARGRYSELFLAHPNDQSNPLPNIFDTNATEARLSGNAVITDRRLFLGSDRSLIEFDLSAISSSIPYRLNLHRKDYQSKCEYLDYVSDGLILLAEQLNDDRMGFSIWDVEKNTIIDRIDINALTFNVARECLFVASSTEIACYKLHSGASGFESCGSAPLGGHIPVSKPALVGGALYLIAAGADQNPLRKLIKWEINKDGRIEARNRMVMEENYLNDLAPIGENYAVMAPNGVSVCDARHNQVVTNCGRNMDTSLDPGTFGRLIAMPIANAPGFSSIEVIVALSGSSVFSTAPFSQIFPDIELWGRFLFVLGRMAGDQHVTLFGYDLMG